MRFPRRAGPALVVVALVAGACGFDSAPSATPAEAASPTPAPTPAPTEVPFAPASVPETGSACTTPGYTGRLGRIEAVDARTVVFTLCAPDGAFPARLAHPVLAIADATAIAMLGEDRAAARSVAGTGPYRVERWVEGDNVVLSRVGSKATADAASPTLILRWNADPAARLEALTDATVDGIDAPGPAELDRLATLPELATTSRPGLETAFLAFGAGPAFSGTRVRRAIAQSLDRATLVRGAFPAGSVLATHVPSCLVEGACGGKPWYDFNAPAADAILADASFDLARRYPLHVPDAPIPGLPDPQGLAAAVASQLAGNVGIQVDIDVMPVADFRAAADRGRLNGLYLDGVATAAPDASGFLEPLFGDDVRSTPARRATGVSTALREAAATADQEARAAAFTRANNAIRSGAVIVPLAHPGSVVAFRGDVDGVATSPLGEDPLGRAVPGDRPQLVFLQGTEPDGAWCGDQSTLDAYRLCGLVAQGLYEVAPDSLAPAPALARCDASDDARTWTCRLRGERTFSDGMTVDAGDVLATFRAGWDASGPVRAAAPEGVFATWDALLGAPFDPGG